MSADSVYGAIIDRTVQAIFDAVRETVTGAELGKQLELILAEHVGRIDVLRLAESQGCRFSADGVCRDPDHLHYVPDLDPEGVDRTPDVTADYLRQTADRLRAERDAARNEIADLHRQRRTQSKKRRHLSGAKNKADAQTVAVVAQRDAARSAIRWFWAGKMPDPHLAWWTAGEPVTPAEAAEIRAATGSPVEDDR